MTTLITRPAGMTLWRLFFFLAAIAGVVLVCLSVSVALRNLFHDPVFSLLLIGAAVGWVLGMTYLFRSCFKLT